MGPYQRTPKEVARAIRYSGLGVRSVGPVGDFLESYILPSGSNSVEILRILRLFWVQVPQCQPINQFCPYFEGYKIPFDIF